MTEKTQEGSSSLVTHQFDVMGAKLKVDVFGDCKLYLRNTGTKDIPIEFIGFYADNKPVEHTPADGTLKKNDVQEIDFYNYLNPGKYKLLIKIYGKTMDQGRLICGGVECIDEIPCDPLEGCSGASYLDFYCNLGVSECWINHSYDCSKTDYNESVPVTNNNLDIACNCNCSGYDIEENTTNGNCNDGKDNDCDGDTDGDDYDCPTAPMPAAFSCYINESCGSDVPILAFSGACNGTGCTELLETNSHAEVSPFEGGYTYKLCCSNVSDVKIVNSTTITPEYCPVGFTGLITLATNATFNITTNAQVEKYNYSACNPTNWDSTCINSTSSKYNVTADDCCTMWNCSVECCPPAEGPYGFNFTKNVCVNLTSGSLECVYGTTTECDFGGYEEYVISISNLTNAHIGNSIAYPDLLLCCKKQT